MSSLNKDKNSFPEKDIRNNMNNLDISDEKHEYAKDGNVQIYDNDDAYMLNFEKENNNDDNDNDPRANISDLDNFDKIKDRENPKSNSHANFSDEIDDHHIESRKGFNDMNITDKHSKKNSLNYNKKENAFSTGNESEAVNSNLITLKYISVCQCCKNNFNSGKHTPFLLKCGHFFCKFCLENNYTDEEGKVYCPEDGCMAKNISELPLLNNLIIDKSKEEENKNEDYCPQHPGQKFTHYIEETKEIICVYCAFNKFKKNPRLEIKEIKEKCNDIMENIDKMLNENQHHADILHDSLNHIKTNKITEEQKVVAFYDKIIKYLEQKKTEIVENINLIFSTNAEKISEKLDHFSLKMQDAEDLKANVITVTNGEGIRINEVMNSFSQYLKESNDSSKMNLELTEYKFAHDDENKLFKYINNCGDLKSKQKLIRFSMQGSSFPNKSIPTANSNNYIPNEYLFTNKESKPNRRINDINTNINMLNNHNISSNNNNIFNSELLESSHFEEFERDELGGRMLTQKSNYNKIDSKEKLKYDLMPTNFDQRKRDTYIGMGIRSQFNPVEDYHNEYSSNNAKDYNFNINRNSNKNY